MQTSWMIPIRIQLTGFIMWKGHKATESLKWLLGIMLSCGCWHDLQLCFFCSCFFSLVLNYKWTTGSWDSSSTWKVKLTWSRFFHIVSQWILYNEMPCLEKKTPNPLRPSSFALKWRVKKTRYKTRPHNYSTGNSVDKQFTVFCMNKYLSN